jgi:hypothetical protein
MLLKFIIAIILFQLFSFLGNAQTYKIDTLRTEYQALETYKSVSIEEDGDFDWEKKFDLPFVFPYYDSLYTHIFCNNNSYCYFEYNPEFDIKLMTFSYQFDNLIDTVNIESDVRYNYVIKNDKQALVLQYTKNRLASDASIDEYDSYINFQLWFYENGAMEVHFGDINLDNSPNYRPGEGFYFTFVDGTEMNSGPEMGVRHPFDEEDQTWLEGDWNDYIVRNGVGYLTTLPPKGFVIRFSKKTSNTTDAIDTPITVYPNPTSHQLTIKYGGNIFKTIIKSISGENIMILDPETRVINTDKLSNGMYILEMHTSVGVTQTKFIKF